MSNLFNRIVKCEVSSPWKYLPVPNFSDRLIWKSLMSLLVVILPLLLRPLKTELGFAIYIKGKWTFHSAYVISIRCNNWPYSSRRPQTTTTATNPVLKQLNLLDSPRKISLRSVSKLSWHLPSSYFTRRLTSNIFCAFSFTKHYTVSIYDSPPQYIILLQSKYSFFPFSVKILHKASLQNTCKTSICTSQKRRL